MLIKFLLQPGSASLCRADGAKKWFWLRFGEWRLRGGEMAAIYRGLKINISGKNTLKITLRDASPGAVFPRFHPMRCNVWLADCLFLADQNRFDMMVAHAFDNEAVGAIGDHVPFHRNTFQPVHEQAGQCIHIDRLAGNVTGFTLDIGQ